MTVGCTCPWKSYLSLKYFYTAFLEGGGTELRPKDLEHLMRDVLRR